MITLEDWIGPHGGSIDATDEVRGNARNMLERVNDLLVLAYTEGVNLHINPSTGSWVSGAGNGGFRPQNSPVGAKFSKHKTGHAVDIYDPNNDIDKWDTDGILEEHGLYREHPDDTPTWCHLQDIPPGPVGAPDRKVRTFKP